MAVNETEAKGSHYHMNGKDTVTELYEECKEYGRGFCYGNIKKYLKRLGKKGATPEERIETEKKDLYKIASCDWDSVLDLYEEGILTEQVIKKYPSPI